MAPPTIPPDTIDHDVAEAALGDAMRRAADWRELAETYAEMHSVALREVRRLTARVREQSQTIRRLTDLLREARGPLRGRAA